MFMTSLEVEQNSKKLDQMEAELKNQELQKLREKDLEEMEALRGERDELKKSLVDARNMMDEIEKRSKEKTNDVTNKLSEANEQIETLQSEQEDLLVMLSDQETQIQEQRNRLKELGVEDEDVEETEDLT